MINGLFFPLISGTKENVEIYILLKKSEWGDVFKLNRIYPFIFSFIYDFLSVVLILYKMNQCTVVRTDHCSR